MEVRFIKRPVGYAYRVGDEVKLDKDLAAKFIETGFAVEAKVKPEPEKKETRPNKMTAKSHKAIVK